MKITILILILLLAMGCIQRDYISYPFGDCGLKICLLSGDWKCFIISPDIVVYFNMKTRDEIKMEYVINKGD